MSISREKPPTAQETFMQMAQAAGLRGRLLVTVGILILIRFGNNQAFLCNFCIQKQTNVYE